MGILNRVLEHPLTRGLSVDDPRTTLLRREIVRNKPFLRTLYAEWYERIIESLPCKNDVLELGSGAGFLQEFLPGVITSEVFKTPGVKLIADACDLPLPDKSLSAIVVTDVFHHILTVRRFLREATRCVRPGGKIVMIERTPWSEWVYRNLHSESFSPESDWLPWIVFERDRTLFEEQYPQWVIKRIEPMMPFSYLFSGGVSMRSLVPGWMYPPIRSMEQVLNHRKWAMFALIELELAP